MIGRKLSLTRIALAGSVLALVGLANPPFSLGIPQLGTGVAVSAQGSNQGNGPTGGRSGSSGRGGPMSPWNWWNDAKVQKELGLSAEKVKRIHDIYTRRSDDLKPIADEYVKQLSELEAMTRARVVDESTYSVQVMRVESARSKLSESRTVMLYRLSRELTSEQYKQLLDIRDRRRSADSQPPSRQGN